MIKRSMCLLGLLVATACSNPDSTPSAGRDECVAVPDVVTLINAANREALAERGVDLETYTYSFTIDSTNLLACERGLTLIDAGLVDSEGNPVPTEMHRYLVERDSAGEWYVATRRYEVKVRGELLGMDCRAMPPKIAGHFGTLAPDEAVTYPRRVCAPVSAAAATTSAKPRESITVGEVPNRPAATAALQAWADDFAAGDIDALVRKCWTISPDRVRVMYADRGPITKAITQPGIDGQFAFVWQDGLTRISVKRSEVSSGYACPYISMEGDVHIYTEEDARYTVERYLSRVIGIPLNAGDTEAKYPLECSGWPPTELTDTSRSIAATTTSFERRTMQVIGGPDDWDVTVVGTSIDGADRQYRYRTSVGSEGYCIAEVA